MSNIDFKTIAEDLIWRNVIDRKNELSGYYIMDKDCGVYTKGTIHPSLAFSSFIPPEYYHEITWKELCLGLKTKGYKSLIPDGHDCSICSGRYTCCAYFKNDPDHERCSGWKGESDETEE